MMHDTLKIIMDTIVLSNKVNSEIKHVDNANLIFGIPIPLFSVIVALLTFIIGIIINWYNKKKARYEALLTIKNTVINWTDLINNSINQKINLLNDFSLRVSTSEDLHPEHFDINPILADKLMSFTLKEYTDAFVLNLKGNESVNAKHLYTIIGQLDFLSKIDIHINEKYEIYHKDSFGFMEEWNSCIFRLNKIRISMHLKIWKPESPQYEFYQNFIKIYDNQKNFSGDFSIKQFKCVIIDPLVELIGNEVYKKFNTEYTVEIYDVLSDFNLIYQKWETNNSGTSGLFKLYLERIISSYKALSTSCDRLKETNLKPIYKII